MSFTACMADHAIEYSCHTEIFTPLIVHGHCLQPNAATVEELAFHQSTDDVVEGQSALGQYAPWKPITEASSAADRRLPGGNERRHRDGLPDAATAQREAHQGTEGGPAGEGGETHISGASCLLCYI